MNVEADIFAGLQCICIRVEMIVNDRLTVQSVNLSLQVINWLDLCLQVVDLVEEGAHKINLWETQSFLLVHKAVRFFLVLGEESTQTQHFCIILRFISSYVIEFLLLSSCVIGFHFLSCCQDCDGGGDNGFVHFVWGFCFSFYFLCEIDLLIYGYNLHIKTGLLWIKRDRYE